MLDKPKRAVTREPGRRYPECVSSHPLREKIDVRRAREQHAVYCKLLEDLGLDVIKMPQDDVHADSCFVEDTAVVRDGKALACRPALTSRRGEVPSVADLLKDYLEVSHVQAPATVEGGDVIHLEGRLVVGITRRTSRAGAGQVSDLLGVKVDTIEDDAIMHLKSYATCLDERTVIAVKRFARHEAFEGMDMIEIPDDEAYAANALAVDDVILMAAGMNESHRLVREAGFRVMPIDLGEFEKGDGAITCLSILF